MKDSFWTGGSEAHTNEIKKRFDARLAKLRTELESAETKDERDKISQSIESTRNARQVELDNCSNKLF